MHATCCRTDQRDHPPRTPYLAGAALLFLLKVRLHKRPFDAGEGLRPRRPLRASDPAALASKATAGPLMVHDHRNGNLVEFRPAESLARRRAPKVTYLRAKCSLEKPAYEADYHRH